MMKKVLKNGDLGKKPVIWEPLVYPDLTEKPISLAEHTESEDDVPGDDACFDKPCVALCFLILIVQPSPN